MVIFNSINSLNYKCYCIEPYSEITTKLKKIILVLLSRN